MPKKRKPAGKGKKPILPRTFVPSTRLVRRWLRGIPSNRQTVDGLSVRNGIVYTGSTPIACRIDLPAANDKTGLPIIVFIVSPATVRFPRRESQAHLATVRRLSTAWAENHEYDPVDQTATARWYLINARLPRDFAGASQPSLRGIARLIASDMELCLSTYRQCPYGLARKIELLDDVTRVANTLRVFMRIFPLARNIGVEALATRPDPAAERRRNDDAIRAQLAAAEREAQRRDRVATRSADVSAIAAETRAQQADRARLNRDVQADIAAGREAQIVPGTGRQPVLILNELFRQAQSRRQQQAAEDLLAANLLAAREMEPPIPESVPEPTVEPPPDEPSPAAKMAVRAPRRIRQLKAVKPRLKKDKK